ncbi:MAG: hypothetical protein IPI73_04085 [Betaproteobacteria bacterium]|nr:hypothetical protein [Betaproteobacteria bacterium]
MNRLFTILTWLLSLAAPAAAQTTCAHHLLVSGYFSTVHVYDACTGAYLRDLDSGTRLAGAQAIRLGPDGLIYVVSEQTNKIHRYRADTLAYVDLFVATPPMAPLSLAFDAAGIAYVAGFKHPRRQEIRLATATCSTTRSRRAHIGHRGSRDRHDLRSGWQPARAGLDFEQRDPLRPAHRRYGPGHRAAPAGASYSRGAAERQGRDHVHLMTEGSASCSGGIPRPGR